jgi:hypothetical protein
VDGNTLNQSAIFEGYKDGTFVDISLNEITAGKTVLFVSLPHIHDFVHHGYVKYLKSFLPLVDNICLVTTNKRFNLVKIATYWPEFSALLDKDLQFTNWVSKQANKNYNNTNSLEDWKYQCVFKDGKLIGFYDNHVPDVKIWIVDKLKNDSTWKKYLQEQDSEILKALKLLIKKPHLYYNEQLVFFMRPTLAPLIEFDKLWPNKEIENLLAKID